ncbi:MAG: BatD family protein, partial [Lewinella sp.]|nr:BatD family protein [Lewinella sp.]
RRIVVSTEPLHIQVQPLPQPAPDNFSGITGHYTLEVRANRNQLTTDDALSLLLTLRGEGDLKRVQAPPLDFPDNFETYDPKVTREDYVDYSDRIQGVKTFEYLVVPGQPGQYVLEPEVVVFDPDSLSYVSLRAAPIQLQVEQGTGQRADPTVVEAPLEDRMHPLLEKVKLIRPRTDRLTGSPFYWVLVLLPFFSLGAVALIRRVQRQRANIDPETLRRQRARQQALARLQTARTHQEKGEFRAFFSEIERALLGYVGDKLQIPRSTMTKANVQARLEQLGAQPDQVSAFMDLLKTCEMALYAGQDNEAAVANAYDRAGDVLADLEAALTV